jgi:hypothetical protein
MPKVIRMATHARVFVPTIILHLFTGAGAFSRDALIERSGKKEREPGSHAVTAR